MSVTVEPFTLAFSDGAGGGSVPTLTVRVAASELSWVTSKMCVPSVSPLTSTAQSPLLEAASEPSSCPPS